MYNKKTSFIITFFLSFIIFPLTYAGYHDSYMDGDISSDWGNGYCYKFNLGNATQETIFGWNINFELDNSTQITGLWGGKKEKSGNKYKISGLDRNSNLNIGHKNVEIGFCTTGGKKPANISFTKGQKKHSDEHYKKSKDKDEKDDEIDYEYQVDDDADTSQVCILNQEYVSKTNIVKNGSFEIFNSSNVVVDWCKNKWNDYFKFIGKFKVIENWQSLNNNYKIWRNADIKAQDGEAFIDIDYGNTISQEIKTGSGNKYELSFYTLGTDEMEVKWNGNTIHKKANSYSGVTVNTESGITIDTQANVTQTGAKDRFSFENNTPTTWSGVSLLPANITTGGTTINSDVYYGLNTNDGANIYKVPGSINWYWIDLRSGDDVLDVGTLNVDVYGRYGNDTIRVNNANRYIFGEYGNDKIQYNSNADYMEAGDGNDQVKIVNNANNTLYLGNGDDQLEVGGNTYKVYGGDGNNFIKINGSANNTIDTNNGNDSVYIGGNTNYINLGDGNNTLSVGGSTNNTIDVGNGSDSIYIANASNGTINMGNGENFLSIGATANETINMGDNNDKLVLKGGVNATVNMGNGDDYVVASASTFNQTIYGGNGSDAIYLKGISSATWNANTNNIKSRINSFEKMIFSDGIEIGFDNDSSNTSSGTINDIDYSSGSSNKAGWVKYTYTVTGKTGNSKLEFSNTNIRFEDNKDTLQGNNYCNKFKKENSCENGYAKNICKWDNNNCISKKTFKYAYNCGWNNAGGVLNFNYSKFTFPTHKNKLSCDIWGNGKKIYMGDGDDYVKYKFGDSNYFSLGNGVNIFAHSIYDSQFTNNTIEGGNGFNKFIIEDEDLDNFDISGDCSTECTISLKNNAYTWWNGWRFSGVKLKKFHEITFKNSKKEYKSERNSDYLFETDVRLGLDNVSFREIKSSENDKIDLMTLINDALKNNVSNGSCSDIFYGLEDSIKKELINKMLASADYTTIAQDFLNTVTANSKQTVVKNVTYELVKDKITPCHSEDEKNAFYKEVYNQTVDKINTCVLNNLNTQVQKQIDAISYLKTNMENCTQTGNTLTLNFFNSYGMYSK